MTALTETKSPILLRPHWQSDDADSRLNRFGWIVVLVAALMAALLIGFATRVDPLKLPDDQGVSALDD